ncbi:hypothetical protein EV1_020385 [Malus domestica]
MATPSNSSSPLESVQAPNPNSSNYAMSSSSYASLTIQNIGSMVPIKLKRSNYLPWRALFAPILRRYKLLGIIDGTEVCPSPLLSDRSINPDFDIWNEKDQNLLIWLNSTLSEEVIPFTVGVSSSRDLWIKLEQRFGVVSDAHIHQLRSRLQSIQKGSQSISDYLQQIKEISDALMAAGAPVTDRDLIAATLAGLPDEFESFTDSLLLRLSHTTLDELHGLLLTKELSMTRRKKAASSNTTEHFHAFAAHSLPPLLPTPPPHQAFAVQPQSSRDNYRGSHRGNYRGNARGHRGNYKGTNFRGNYQGFRGNSQGSRGIQCQICGSNSHEAIDCFDRMNPDIFGKVPPAKLAAMCAHFSSKPTPSWLIDSGATSHITNDISNISSPTPYRGEDKVYIGDGKGLTITNVGSSFLHTPSATFKLQHVLHVPQMQHNLLSAYQFLKDNYCSLTLNSDGSFVKDRSTGKTLLRGPVKDGFYPLQCTSQSSQSSHRSATSPTALISVKASISVWHSRLGHPSSSIFRRVLSTNKLALTGKASVDFFCSHCALAKSHKQPFSSVSSTSSSCLELLHCDLWGPAPVMSVSGSRYYLLIVDDYSKYSWFFPLQSKSAVYSVLVQFKSYVENLLGNKIKVFRSDSGGEFTSTALQNFFKTHGIIHQFSCPHTPEQNGCAERKHRHLVETARTLLVASNVPHVFWVEAFSTAIYLINRLPISGMMQSPWELLFHTFPDYCRLKVFGCSCFPWLKPYTTSKLDSKSKYCVFLGYSLQHKGYRCLDPLTQRVYISRHVIFDESTFPFHHSHPLSPSASRFNTASPVVSSVDLQFTVPHSSRSCTTSASLTVPPTAPIASHAPTAPTAHTAPIDSHAAPVASHADYVASHVDSVTSHDLLAAPIDSHDPTVDSIGLPISVPSVSSTVHNTHPMLTRSKAGIFKPKAFSATKHPLPSSLDFVPSTYLQASKHAHWRTAM